MLQVHKAKLRKQRFSKRQRRQAQVEAGRRHMVLPREDLTSIARKHNVLVADIERLNPGTLCNTADVEIVVLLPFVTLSVCDTLHDTSWICSA